MADSVPDPQSELPLRVAVVGGSLGGLATAIALQSRGYIVDVFEKSEGSLESRGGGIVVQPELREFIKRYDLQQPQPLVTRCTTRRIRDRSGDRPQDFTMPQSFTSWDALFGQLKRLFPNDRYHTGRKVVSYQSDDIQATVRFDDGTTTTADLIVCVDGSDSWSRRSLCPQASTRYAGYVAWRGFVRESALEEGLVEQFEDRFSFYHQDSGHILCYFIPEAGADVGPDGFVVRGQRRLNWVWYMDVAEGDALQRVLTDRDGNLRRLSMPAGLADPVLVSELRSQARAELPLAMAKLVESTPEPFLQVISDVTVPTGVFSRICLLGDAAFVVRPHTAAATAKAFAEAMRLAELLDGRLGLRDALTQFDDFQQSIGQRLSQQGVELGQRRG